MDAIGDLNEPARQERLILLGIGAVTLVESTTIQCAQRAAEWARETLGLDFARLREDGVILTGLRTALEEAVKAGEVIRRRGVVSRGTGTE